MGSTVAVLAMIAWLPFERRWRDELCRSIVPRQPRRPPDDTTFDRLLRAAPPPFRFALRISVWMLTWSPIVVLRRARTFGALPADERDVVLLRVTTGRWYVARQLAGVLRLAACVSLVGDPAMRAATIVGAPT